MFSALPFAGIAVWWWHGNATWGAHHVEEDCRHQATLTLLLYAFEHRGLFCMPLCQHAEAHLHCHQSVRSM